MFGKKKVELPREYGKDKRSPEGRFYPKPTVETIHEVPCCYCKSKEHPKIKDLSGVQTTACAFCRVSGEVSCPSDLKEEWLKFNNDRCEKILDRRGLWACFGGWHVQGVYDPASNIIYDVACERHEEEVKQEEEGIDFKMIE